MSDVFAPWEGESQRHEAAVARFDQDMKEAVRMLMHRREGRVFVRWLLEYEDRTAVMRRIMDYMEEMHV